MVSVLEGRHGAWAADVADFFATFHSLKGDARAAGPGPAWPRSRRRGRGPRVRAKPTLLWQNDQLTASVPF